MSLTLEVLQKTLPDKYKRQVNQELLDTILTTLNDPTLYEEFAEGFLSYLDVLQDGKYKITDYLNAIKYCTYKLMGNTNQESYIKAFPDRYNRMLSNGMSAKEISSFVSKYNQNDLVNRIMAQSMIPTWILNQDKYQKAINIQYELMMDKDVSPKVRSDAANSLLIHLKPPEVKKVELDIGVKSNKEIDEMRTLLAELSAKQKNLIDNGIVSLSEVAKTKIVEAEYEELD